MCCGNRRYYSCVFGLAAAVLLLQLSACRFGTTMPSPYSESAETKIESAEPIELSSPYYRRGAALHGEPLPRGAQAILNSTIVIGATPASVRSDATEVESLPDDLSDIAQLAKDTKSKNPFGHPTAKHPLRGGHLRNPPAVTKLTRSQLSFQPSVSETATAKAREQQAAEAQARARLKPAKLSDMLTTAKESAKKAIGKADSIITGIKESLGVQDEQQDQATDQSTDQATEELSEANAEEKLAEALAERDAVNAAETIEAKASTKDPAIDTPVVPEEVTVAEETAEVDAPEKDETAVEETTDTVAEEVSEEEETEQDEGILAEQQPPSSADDTASIEPATAPAAAANSFMSKLSFGGYSLLHEGIVVLAILAGFFIVTWMRLEYEYGSKKK